MIADVACSECGCFEQEVFNCNCGAVHANYCSLCGKFPSSKPTDPKPICTKGRVAHTHTLEERMARHDIKPS